MKRIHSRAWRRSLCGALPLALALLAGWAPPASAVRVIDVRVGQHGEFTRIVFDLDGPTRYQLEHREAGAGIPELVVHFDASAQPKVVRTLSKLVEGVRLEARPEGAAARITLRARDVHAVEETLSSPPRIVIDLRASTQAEVAAAKRPAATPPKTAASQTAVAFPAPGASEPAATPPKTAVSQAPVVSPPLRGPEPVAQPPKTAVSQTPSASASPRASEPAAAPVASAPSAPRTTAEVIEAQADAAAARLLGEQAAPKANEGAAPSPAPSTPAEPPAPAASRPASTVSASAPPPPAPLDRPEPPRALGAPPPHQPFASPPWNEPWGFVTAAVLLVVGLFVLFLFRRREPGEDIHAGALPADAFLDRMAAFGDGSERGAEEHDAEARERTEALPLFAAASASDRSVALAAPEKGGSGHEDSLFGDHSGRALGPERSVTDSDLERPSPAVAERAVRTGILPVPHTDASMGQMLRDLEQRLAGIEQRLARDADARERLERQVVAQTEELRVQRAAIARTQRVLRTLSRPEDLATEPVIKSPGPPSGSPD